MPKHRKGVAVLHVDAELEAYDAKGEAMTIILDRIVHQVPAQSGDRKMAKEWIGEHSTPGQKYVVVRVLDTASPEAILRPCFG